MQPQKDMKQGTWLCRRQNCLFFLLQVVSRSKQIANGKLPLNFTLSKKVCIL